MVRSRTTTWGRSASTRSRHSTPSEASPTTSMSGSELMSIRTPARTTGWSSATSTVILPTGSSVLR